MKHRFTSALAALFLSLLGPPAAHAQVIGGGGGGVPSCSGGQFVKGPGTCATPAGGGNVSGPGSSTDGNIVTWSGASGTLLATGLVPNSLGGTAGQVVVSNSLGLVDTSFMPSPTASTLGGIESFAAITHQWLRAISTAGVPSASQPACGDLSDSGTGCSSTYTASTGVTLSGVNFVLSPIAANSVPANATGGSAAPITAVPYGTSGSSTILETGAGGKIAAGVLPNPTASTLGGVESLAAVTSNWINSISTSGVPTATQPAFSDLSGSATLAQLPSITNNTALGNVSGGSAVPSALTATQLTTLCNNFTSALSGCVPSPLGATTTFLRADGSWIAPPGASYTASTGITLSGTNFVLSSIAANSVPANASGSSGPPTTAVSYGTSGANTILETGAGGTILASALPNPTASTLGGIESLAAVTSKWINTISTSGVPSATQPACGDLSNSGTGCTTTVGTMATQNASGVAITGGSFTGLASPVNPSDAVTKAYVDGVSTSTFYHTPVAAATAAVLPNTPSFSSATCATTTLTSGTNTALVVDGYTVLLNDRVLVQNQAAPAQNGIYSETQLGTGSVPWILTRATDFNTVAAGNIALGAAVLVQNGTAPRVGGNFWMSQSAAITCNTTALTWVQSASTTIYTASTGVTLSGTNFMLSTISGNSVPANASGSAGAPTTAVAYGTTGNNTILETGAGGTIAASTLPVPSASTLGGVESIAAVTSNWVNSISTSGVPTLTQPAFSDLSGSATLAQFPSVATNTVIGRVAAGSGVPSALTATQLTTLCNAFSATLSGCAPLSGGGTTAFLRADGTWVAPPLNTYTSSGGITLTGANFALSSIAANSVLANVSGSPGIPSTALCYGATSASTSCLLQLGAGGLVSATVLPVPSASTLGGVESLAAVTSKWINSISTSGVPTATQPACSDLSNSGTGCSTTYTGSNGITLTSANFALTSIAANSVPVNASGSPGPPITAVSYGTSGNNTLLETGGAGKIAAATIPVPSASTLGGTESLTCATSFVLFEISTAGVPVCEQLGFSDLAGNAVLAQLPLIANLTALGNVSGGSASPVALSTAQFTTLCNQFTATLSGCAPASGGGTLNFLRSDGAWTVPLGSGGGGTTPTITVPAYYVAVGGSDTADGLAASVGGGHGPFATLAHCQTAMQGGAVKWCYVRAGTQTLPSGGLSFTAADNGETWSYYPPDGKQSAVINYSAVTPGTIGWLSTASPFTINGLNFLQTTTASLTQNQTMLYLQGNSNTFTNNMVDGNGTASALVYGLDVYGNGDVISGNTFFRINSPGPGSSARGINIAAATFSNSVISNNLFACIANWDIFDNGTASSSGNLIYGNNFFWPGYWSAGATTTNCGATQVDGNAPAIDIRSTGTVGDLIALNTFTGVPGYDVIASGGTTGANFLYISDNSPANNVGNPVITLNGANNAVIRRNAINSTASVGINLGNETLCPTNTTANNALVINNTITSTFEPFWITKSANSIFLGNVTNIGVNTGVNPSPHYQAAASILQWDVDNGCTFQQNSTGNLFVDNTMTSTNAAALYAFLFESAQAPNTVSHNILFPSGSLSTAVIQNNSGGTITATDNKLTSGGTVSAAPPLPNAGPAQIVMAGSTVTLNGSAALFGSTTGTIGYAWSQVAGTPVTINNATNAVANFTAPPGPISQASVLVFKLTASITGGSGNGTSAYDEVMVGLDPSLVASSSSGGGSTQGPYNTLVPTGVEATDRAALQNAINASSNGGLAVYLTPGIYNVCHSLTSPNGHEMVLGTDINNFTANAGGTASNTVVTCTGTPAFTAGKGIINPGSYSLYQGFTVRGGGTNGAPVSLPAYGTGYVTTSTTLNISTTISGAWAIGQYVIGENLLPGTKITAGSGSTWTIAPAQAQANVGNSGAPVRIAGTALGYSCIDVENTIWATLDHMWAYQCDHGIDAYTALTGANLTQGLSVHGGAASLNNGWGFYGGAAVGASFADGNLDAGFNPAANLLGGIYVWSFGTSGIQHVRSEDNDGPGLKISSALNSQINNNQFDSNGLNFNATAGVFPNVILSGGIASYSLEFDTVQFNNNVLTYPFRNNFSGATCATGGWNLEFGDTVTNFTATGNTYDNCATYTWKARTNSNGGYTGIMRDTPGFLPGGGQYADANTALYLGPLGTGLGNAVLTGSTQTITAAEWVTIDVFDVTAASQTLTLPASSGLATNGAIFVRTVNGQSVALAPTGADTINGVNATLTIPAGLSVIVTTDGAGSFRAPLGLVPTPVSIGWVAGINPNNAPVVVINQASTISAAIGAIETATGGTATVSVYVATAGQACSVGSSISSNSVNANLTNVSNAGNQPLTLTTTTITAGSRLCLQTTGTTTWTSGSGVGGITVYLSPL